MSDVEQRGQSPDPQGLSPVKYTAPSAVRGILRYSGGGLFVFCCVVLALGATYAVLSLCGVDLYAKLGLTKLKCGFHELTGLYCPGCGGTRSMLALLRFRPLRSVMYHPLPIYAAALLVNFMVRFVSAYLLPASVKHRLKPAKYRVVYVAIGAALLVGTFIVRNALLIAGIDTL